MGTGYKPCWHCRGKKTCTCASCGTRIITTDPMGPEWSDLKITDTIHYLKGKCIICNGKGEVEA